MWEYNRWEKELRLWQKHTWRYIDTCFFQIMDFAVIGTGEVQWWQILKMTKAGAVKPSFKILVWGAVDLNTELKKNFNWRNLIASVSTWDHSNETLNEGKLLSQGTLNGNSIIVFSIGSFHLCDIWNSKRLWMIHDGWVWHISGLTEAFEQ